MTSSLQKIMAAGNVSSSIKRRGKRSIDTQKADEVKIKQENIDKAVAAKQPGATTSADKGKAKEVIDLEKSPARKKQKDHDGVPDVQMDDVASASSLSSKSSYNTDDLYDTTPDVGTPSKKSVPPAVVTEQKEPSNKSNRSSLASAAASKATPSPASKKKVTYATAAQKGPTNKLDANGKPVASIFKPRDNSREHYLYVQCRMEVDPREHTVKTRPNAPAATQAELKELIATINGIDEVEALIVRWEPSDARESDALVHPDKLPKLPSKLREFIQGVRAIKNHEKGGMTIRFRVGFNGDKETFIEAAKYSLAAQNFSQFQAAPLQDPTAVRTAPPSPVRVDMALRSGDIHLIPALPFSVVEIHTDHGSSTYDL